MDRRFHAIGVTTMSLAKRRISILSSGLGRGGAEKQLEALALALAEAGAIVEITSMIPCDESRFELAARHVAISSLEMKRGRIDPRTIATYTRRLRERRPQLLVAFNTPACLMARIAGRAASVPVIVSSLRNERVGGLGREWFLRWTDSLGHASCTNSTAVAESLVRRRIVPGNRIRVIPNGLQIASPLDVNVPRVRARLGISAATFLWVAIGRLEPQKDYSNLLSALGHLRSRGASFSVAVAGAGPLRAALEHATHDAGLNDHVSWLGLRDDIPQLLAAADALVLSSRWEGLPNVVMEALAAGVPAVATKVGGVAELIDDGRTGFVVPVSNAQALSDAMSTMMQLPGDARREMGALGREHMARHFSMERSIARWFELFEELLGARSAGRAA